MSERTTHPELADRLVDELLGDDFDWRSKVRAYPTAALLIAAGAGFVLGTRRGEVLISTLGGWAASELADNLGRLWSTRSGEGG